VVPILSTGKIANHNFYQTTKGVSIAWREKYNILYDNSRDTDIDRAWEQVLRLQISREQSRFT
jgi:hypothetical protein